MNIVLDTNVLVAGLLSPFGPCGEIVRMVSSGELKLSYDARILAEYGEVLRRKKFRFHEEKVASLLDQIRHGGLPVASSPLPVSLPDPDDEPFLEVAMAGQVVCLITGNLDHFPPPSRAGVMVLPPSEFLAFLKKRRR
jgi:uncharacterized protein